MPPPPPCCSGVSHDLLPLLFSPSPRGPLQYFASGASQDRHSNRLLLLGDRDMATLAIAVMVPLIPLTRTWAYSPLGNPE